jgi:two-component system OmpR family sensor kinase
MPGRLVARLQATPLRSRLVGLLLLLVAAALLLAGAAVVAALRGYLFSQVDRNLTDMVRPIASAPLLPVPDAGFGPDRPGPVGRDVIYVRLSDPTGTTHEVPASSATVTDPPVLPDLTVAEAMALDGRGYVVDSESGDTRWRVISAPLADGSGSVSVAQDIGGIDATVNRLVLI